MHTRKLIIKRGCKECFRFVNREAAMRLTAVIITGLFCFSQTHAAFAAEPVGTRQDPLIEQSIYDPAVPPPQDNRPLIENLRNQVLPGAHKRNTEATVFPVAHHASAAVTMNRYLYVMGGVLGNGGPQDAQNMLHRYNPITGDWAALAPMPTPRHSLSAVGIGNYIYAVGGHVANSMAEVERYDIINNRWDSMAPMNTARGGAGVTAYQGKIYVFGGNQYGTLQSSVEYYNPKTNTWTYVGKMPEATEPWRAVTLGNKIYIQTGNATNGYEQLWAYDPVRNKWDTALPRMNIDRTAYELIAANGRIYAVGGWRATSASPLASIESWAPGETQWRVESHSLNTGRFQMASGVIANEIYVVGGWNGSHLASVEKFSTPNLKNRKYIRKR